jgi:hypothetical protein
MLTYGLMPIAAPPKAYFAGYPAVTRSTVRTTPTWPCCLKRRRNSSAAARIASSRSPRGQVATASSNSWNGRMPAVVGRSIVAMRVLHAVAPPAIAGASRLVRGREPASIAAVPKSHRNCRPEVGTMIRGIKFASIPAVDQDRALAFNT